MNNGLIKPDKILICVPKATFPKFLFFKKNSNFEFIQCPIKGQVKQKTFGFTKVTSKYTFQIDDDILVHKTCLKFLLYAAKTKSSKNAFGACLKSTKNMVSENITPGFLKQIVNLFFYGQRRLKMRSILNTGIATDLFDQKNVFLSKTEWLNGILFTNTKNLIKSDYFKLDGKAYNEDIIYSGMLKKNNINLWVTNKALCFEQKQNFYNNTEKWDVSYWMKIYKTRRIIISLYEGTLFKLIVFMYLEMLKLFFNKIFTK